MSDPNLLFEIDGFPKYFVGTDSNIYSEWSGEMKKMKLCDNGKGYTRVNLCKDGKIFERKTHRLVGQMFIPNPDNLPCIDHINRNSQDNRIENLRWVSHIDNMRNQKKYKTNTSGFQGVYFDKKGNSWVAGWQNKECKQKYKYFSIKKYGNEQAKQLAIEHRQKMVDLYYNRPT